MPASRSYGDILRHERERSGYDIMSMANRLHIRPDILQSIENADFDRMPARGYSKNMIRAYARALRLNEQEIMNMYLDEVHYYESGSPRNPRSNRRSQAEGAVSRAQSRPSGRREPRSSRNSRYDDMPAPNMQDRGSRQPRQASRRGHRDLVENPVNSRNIQGVQRNASSQGRGVPRTPDKPRKAATAVAGLGSLVGSIGRGRSEGKVPRSFSTIGSTPPYAQNNTKQKFSFANMNLPMLLAIVAGVIVLIIVIVVVTNGSKQASENVPSIPISGLTDTSSPEDQNQTSGVEVPPKNAQVVYTIADGQSAWLEIYQDGSDEPVYAAVAEGGSTDNFDVTGTLTIKTPNPAAVTVTVNGDKVELSSSGSSMYSYTVDFKEILKKWNEEHGVGEDSTADSSSSSASSVSSSSSSSASSASSSSRSSTD